MREGGYCLGEPECRLRSCLGGNFEWRHPEHQMRRPSPQYGAGNLHDDIGERSVPLNLTPQQEGERDKRIEMRAGHRTHRADQHDEDGPGRRRVAEQRERGIAARQPLAHDAGADDGREQEPGAQPFSSQPSRKTLRLHGLYAGSLEIALLVRPILSSSF